MTTASQGVSLRFEADARALESHLALMAAEGVSMSPNLRADIGEYFLGNIQDNLDDQRLFDGTAMPQSQAAIDRQGKTLIDRHHLYDSYVYQVTPGGVEVGSNSVYARIHHFGGVAGRRSARIELDARPVMGLTDDDQDHIGQMILDELRRLQPGGPS